MSRFDARLEGLNAVIRELRAAPAQIKRAEVRTYNSIVTTTRKVAVNDIKGQVGIKPTIARKRLMLNRASARQDQPRASIVASDRPIPLRRGFKTQRVRTKYGIGVRADISMERGMEQLPATFIQRAINPKAILQREKLGPGRYAPRTPIVSATAPGMAEYFRPLLPRAANEANRHLSTRFRRELEFELNRGRRRA